MAQNVPLFLLDNFRYSCSQMSLTIFRVMPQTSRAVYRLKRTWILMFLCNENIDNVVKYLRPSVRYTYDQTRPPLVQIISCRLFGAKPLCEPLLPCWELGIYLTAGNILLWNLDQHKELSLKKINLLVSSADRLAIFPSPNFKICLSFSYIDIEFIIWIFNYNHVNQCDIITHSCPYFTY